MNREILFHGKRKDTGEWVEGDLVRAYRCVEGDPINVCLDGVVLIMNETGLHSVDPSTVGQYTGLPDKNGKKIFEGDCLRLSSETTGTEGDGVCVVHFGRFRDTDALADFDHLGWYVTISTIPNEATTIYVLEENDIAFEVIGNIHDNPELLES